MTPRDDLTRPHHDGSPVYAATDSPSPGDQVEVRLRVPAAIADGVDQVWLRTTPDAEPHMARLTRDGTDRGDDMWAGTVAVRNPVNGYRFLVTGSGMATWVNQAGAFDHDVPDAGDHRLVAFGAPPDWLDEAILYQVFPDRFARSGRVEADRGLADWDEPVITQYPASMSQWYGGDLYGVADHLDHVAALGATAIYLNPIFPAPENHRYCAASFDRVDPLLGGDAGLAALTSAAHDRGIRVIGDLTANHTGDSHDWFAAARAGQEPERGFYRWIDEPDSWESWGGVGTLPRLDHASTALRERLLTGPDSVARRWLRDPIGLDGWRVDAANIAGRGATDDFTHRIAADLRAVLAEERPDGFLLAEHCHDASGDLDEDGWHATMDYAGFTRPVWQWLRDPTATDLDLLDEPVQPPVRDGHAVRATMDAFRSNASWQAHRHRVHLLGSHDTSRWAQVPAARDGVVAGFGLLFAMPGIPSIFAGDEFGLTNPTTRTRDGSRLPMPWSDGAAWDRDLLATVTELGTLRRSTPALRLGGFRWASTGPDHLAFLREHPDGDVLVVAARAAVDVAVTAGGTRRRPPVRSRHGHGGPRRRPSHDGGPGRHAGGRRSELVTRLVDGPQWTVTWS